MQAYPGTTMGQQPVYVINAGSASPMPTHGSYSSYGESPAMRAQELAVEAQARTAPTMIPQTQTGMGMGMPVNQGMMISSSLPANGLASGMPYPGGMFHHHHHGMGYGGGYYGSTPYSNMGYGGGMMPAQGGMGYQQGAMYQYPQQYQQYQQQPTVIHVPHSGHRHHRHHHRHRSY